jgi:hypothetical protein
MTQDERKEIESQFAAARVCAEKMLSSESVAES